MNKVLVVKFHCDHCGNDFDVFGTTTDKEQENKYHCIHCGTKGKNLYSFDDYYINDKRVKE
jgi:predicted RNA-binding Zn-ribbon protein involved in translation (DUF1610 family)